MQVKGKMRTRKVSLNKKVDVVLSHEEFSTFQLFLWHLARAYAWAAFFIKKYLGWDNPLTTKSSATKPEKTDA
jgi:hypothetical protein